MASTKIAVVGAGVIGLTTALEIQKNIPNVSVTVFTEKTSPNTTGDVSAGLWMPYLLQGTPKEKSTQWAKETHLMILDFWKRGLAKEVGASLQPIIRLVTGNDTDVPDWMPLSLGFAKLNPKYLDQISTNQQRKYTGGCMFVAFILEPSKFLPYIENQFKVYGGTLTMRKVDDIQCLFKEGFDIVINCTGLNARYVAQDNRVMPVRGQVARVSAPWQFHVILDESDDGNYIIPNTECVVLGGTHQENDYNLKVYKEDKQMILEGCNKMVPSLTNAKILKHQVGLRPGRSQVRLEIEEKLVEVNSNNPIKKWIVHNYGHGGSGVTLCQGCALEATDLVRKILSENYNAVTCKL